MPKVNKTCDCGRQFATYPSVNKRHCSISCSLRFQPRKPRTGETIACEQCGIAFYQNPTEARKGHGRYCSRDCHNRSQRKTPVVKVCALDGCEAVLTLKPSQSRVRFCSRDHQALGRIKRPGGLIYNGRPVKRDAKGYLMVWEPTHPNKSLKGWQYEHRLIAERVLGRYLLTDEHVDHINRDKSDNRPENLQVLSQGAHAIKSSREFQSDIAALRADRAELDEYRRRYGPLTQEV